MTSEVGVPRRSDARRRAFDLVVEAQVAGTDVLPDARQLADEARRAGWSDVRALADYVIAVVQWWRSPGAPEARDHAELFVGWAERADEPLAMALARCSRALLRTAGAPAGHFVDDALRAYEVAERIHGREDRAFALHEIACLFHAMGLWELTVELYDEVDALAAGMDGPRALVGSLAYNRYCTLTTQLLHAHEIGDVAEVLRHSDEVEALAAAPVHPAVPEAWRPDITTFTAICRILVGRADAEAATAMLEAKRWRGVDHEQIDGLLHCVVGWHWLEHGRYDEAVRLVSRGAAALEDAAEPAWHTFASWLEMRLRVRTASAETRAAVERYQRALVDERESARVALVRSVRARLHAGRLRAERDRYARESLTDSLTGLANRRALESRLATVTPALTMIIVDIDQFKPVNDRFGHDTGDRVLRRIGQILLDCIRPGDLAARLGGDEFVLLLEAADRAVAVRRGYEVRDRVRSERWHELHAGLEIAVSVGVGWGARTSTDLYRDADEGLYHAKRAGGARVRGSWNPPALSEERPA